MLTLLSLTFKNCIPGAPAQAESPFRDGDESLEAERAMKMAAILGFNVVRVLRRAALCRAALCWGRGREGGAGGGAARVGGWVRWVLLWAPCIPCSLPASTLAPPCHCHVPVCRAACCNADPAPPRCAAQGRRDGRALLSRAALLADIDKKGLLSLVPQEVKEVGAGRAMLAGHARACWAY